MNSPEIVEALAPIATELERLSVPYYVGGSLASSANGVARATADIDLVAILRPDHVASLVQHLQETYYVDAESIVDAIRRHASANLIHLSTMLKADLFIPGPRAFDREIFGRLRRAVLDPTVPERTFPIPSPEDIVLLKLEWYMLGSQLSDRQWNDILGVLKVQGPSIDLVYLRTWARSLAVSNLLTRALADSGLNLDVADDV